MIPEHRHSGPGSPSVRDVRVFGVLWLVFFVALAWMVHMGGGRGVGGRLVWAGALLGLCVLVALVLGRALPLRRRIAGLAIPLALAAIGLAPRWLTMGGGGVGLDAHTATRRVAAAVAAVGVLGAAAVIARPAVGARVYRGWMAAAEPIGWTISHALLAVVFFFVLTPLGLAMRLFSGDPMRRAYDPDAKTYWLPRRSAPDRRSYFRQF